MSGLRTLITQGRRRLPQVVVGIIFSPALGGGVTVPLFFAAAVAFWIGAVFDSVKVLNGRILGGGNPRGSTTSFVIVRARVARRLRQIFHLLEEPWRAVGAKQAEWDHLPSAIRCLIY